MPAIDPSFLTTGPDWSIGLNEPGVAGGDSGLDGIDSIGGDAGGGGFGGVLGRQLENLSQLQGQASEASAALATGTATDPAETVMAVERARLSMQLASTLRTKGVEAITEIFHTQV